MEADDRVLVGVVKTKRDLNILREQQWYRIPKGQAVSGVDADYLAFFLTARVAADEAGVYHYAARRGQELARRKDLLPSNKSHPRDEHLYYKIQLGTILNREPPIVNKPRPYRFAFIYTTGDRFMHAQHIRDLYSTADYFVDRIFHVLKNDGYAPQRLWEQQRPATIPSEIEYPTFAQIRLIADRGEVVATTSPDVQAQSDQETIIYLQATEKDTDVSAASAAIIDAVNRLGGPKILDLPIDPY